MRVLMVFDGTSWFLRGIHTTVEDSVGELAYHCNEHLGGPYEFEKAVTELRKLVGR